MDHPRSRGVYLDMGSDYVTRDGSSPLARGLRTDIDSFMARVRIIPARAGFTELLSRDRERRQDHPRSRGVYLEAFPAIVSRYGSSPLARGLLRFLSFRYSQRGIIPARAGFTNRNACRDPASTDHPRSRGVYDPVGVDVHPTRGSSPLARGLRVDIDPNGTAARIIPARAGFTY